MIEFDDFLNLYRELYNRLFFLGKHNPNINQSSYKKKTGKNHRVLGKSPRGKKTSRKEAQEEKNPEEKKQ